MSSSTSASTPHRLKYLSLIVLIGQTTALVLVLRYSRTMKISGPRYLSSTAVLASEVVKLFTCLGLILREHNWSPSGLNAAIDAEVYQKRGETMKVAVPAVLYVLQNNLLFFALSKLDAATYQVTYQLKILTTALFSVSMLNRQLNPLKWFALLLLMIGVALVQLPANSATQSGRHSWTEQAMGLGAVLAACVSSGFSGVYFERILKGTPTSVWIRNMQLAFFSIWGSLLMVLLYDYRKVAEHGIFQGYNLVIAVVVLLQAYGGLVIAVVVKYADNILKGFAVSLSIILSSLMSYFVLGDFQPSLTFATGATVVIVSTFMYGYQPKPKPKPPQLIPLAESNRTV